MTDTGDDRHRGRQRQETTQTEDGRYTGRVGLTVMELTGIQETNVMLTANGGRFRSDLEGTNTMETNRDDIGWYNEDD